MLAVAPAGVLSRRSAAPHARRQRRLAHRLAPRPLAAKVAVRRRRRAAAGDGLAQGRARALRRRSGSAPRRAACRRASRSTRAARSTRRSSATGPRPASGAMHRHRARASCCRFKRRNSDAHASSCALSDDGFAYRAALRGPARRRVHRRVQRVRGAGGQQRLAAALQRRLRGPVRGRRCCATSPPARSAFPALLQAARPWMLLTESRHRRGPARVRTSSVRAGTAGRARRVTRPHQAAGPRRACAPPWRVAVIGSLATIVESDLVDDLAEPARPADWSWVRPGRVAWSWWSDSASPASLERQRQYVDFAARVGWEYVLVDAGWDPAWIPRLTAYARRRHVRVLLWSPWDALRAARRGATRCCRAGARGASPA